MARIPRLPALSPLSLPLFLRSKRLRGVGEQEWLKNGVFGVWPSRKLGRAKIRKTGWGEGGERNSWPSFTRSIFSRSNSFPNPTKTLASFNSYRVKIKLVYQFMFMSVSKEQLISHDEQSPAFSWWCNKPGFQQLWYAEEASARNSVRTQCRRPLQPAVCFFCFCFLFFLRLPILAIWRFLVHIF